LFLYPALAAGFFFVGVPLLVHLINLLRHKRQRWAAMEFLLASYRKQKKWVRLRQFLLLLSRLVAAALLIAMLAGWTGSGGILSLPGGATTHHVVIVDDSYSMGEIVDGQSAYSRALRSVEEMTRRFAGDDGNHQLTILRASRATMALRAGGDSADAASDLIVQSVSGDGQLVSRFMATSPSSLRTDLSAATELAVGLIESTPADSTSLYIASDFRASDWTAPERVASSLRTLSSGVSIRLIDCGSDSGRGDNLAVTELAPMPDVWVAGVPVVVRAKIRNYGSAPVKNVPLMVRVIRYGNEVKSVDVARDLSGVPQSLPAPVIEYLAPGAVIVKSFQVYITEPGTHGVEVALPDDALAIDNRRVCTLPLTDAEKVLVIDGGLDGKGAFHVASVLDPGSQVRIGAVPDVRPPAFLRSITVETLSTYRAVYLVDVAELGSNACDALGQYVQRGGGLAMFLGPDVSRLNYNEGLITQDRKLLPLPLGGTQPLAAATDGVPDVLLGDTKLSLIQPLSAVGDSAFNLVGLSDSWLFEDVESSDDNGVDYQVALKRRDGSPLVTVHDFGRGRVMTVMTGLGGQWTNWPGDPTFVVFLLQANAYLWSGAAPTVGRLVDDPMTVSSSSVVDVSGVAGDNPSVIESVFYPPRSEPPRLGIEMTDLLKSQTKGEPGSQASVSIDPANRLREGDPSADDYMRPGLGEWSFLQSDGSIRVEPTAVSLRMGENDLQRLPAAAVIQALRPINVSFLSSSAWSIENNRTASSKVALILLGLLAVVLAVEQTLAAWASYHVRPRRAGAASA
jgi:hypothetical protein